MSTAPETRPRPHWWMSLVTAMFGCGAAAAPEHEGTTLETDALETSGSATADPDGSTTDVESSSDAATEAGDETSSTPQDCAGVDLEADPEHCGACERSCLGGACEGGVCQPVAYPFAWPESNPAYPREVAADADGIYFRSLYAHNEVVPGSVGQFRMSRRGEDPEQLGFRPGDDVHIFPQQDVVYFYTSGVGSNVLIYDKATATAVESGHSGGADAIHHALPSAEFLFFGGSNWVYARDPSNTTELAFFPEELWFPKVAGNDDDLFASKWDFESGSLLRVSRSAVLENDGSNMQMELFFDQSLSQVRALTASAEHVYAATDEALFAIDIATATATELERPPHTIRSMVLNGSSLYVSTVDTAHIGDQPHSIVRVPLRGGTPEVFAESHARMSGPWFDDIGILWTTEDPPAIWQLVR